MSFDPVRFVIGLAMVAASFLIPGAQFLLGPGISMIASSFSPSVKDANLGAQLHSLRTHNEVPTVYGQRRVAGVENKPALTADNSKLYTVICISHGSANGEGIEGVGNIFLNGEPIADATDSGDGVWREDGIADPYSGKLAYAVHLGSAFQTADVRLHTADPAMYPTTARGAGIAYVVLELEYDKELWPAQRIWTFDVQGLKVHNPILDLWAWTQNAALCTRDMLTAHVHGADAREAELDNLVDWGAVIDLCDELVTEPDGMGGTTQRIRYACDAWVSNKEGVPSRLMQLASCASGKVLYQSGKFRLVVPHKVDAPLDFVVDAEMCVRDVEWRMPGLRNDGANSINAIFVAEDKNDQTDTVIFPRPEDGPNIYLAEDNDFDATHTMELPAVTNRYQAFRLARQRLLQMREGDIFVVTLREPALSLESGNVVQLDKDMLGEGPPLPWFTILEMGLMQSGLHQIVLQRYVPEAWQDATLVEEPANPVGNFPTRDNPDTSTVFACALTTDCTGGGNVLASVTWVPPLDAQADVMLLRWRWQGETSWRGLGGQPVSAGQFGWVAAGVAGSVLEVEGQDFNVFGRTAFGGGISTLSVFVLNQMTGDDPWTHHCEVDLSRSPLALNIGWGDFIIEHRAGSEKISIELTGEVADGTRLQLYVAPSCPVDTTAVNLMGEAVAIEAEVDLDLGVPGTGNLETWVVFRFTPPVSAGDTYAFKVCIKDCLTGVLGEPIGCSACFSEPGAGDGTGGMEGNEAGENPDDTNTFFPGIGPTQGGDSAFLSCVNIAGLDAPTEFCIDGVGVLRGHAYAAIPLDTNCLAPGQVISASADVKAGSGGLFCEVNPAGDFALVSSGLMGREFFTSDPFAPGSPWVVDSDPSDVAWEQPQSRIKFDPAAGSGNHDHELFMRWVGTGCSFPANPRSFSMWAAYEYDGTFDERINHQPRLMAVDRLGDEFGIEPGTYGIYMQQTMWFGAHVEIGSIINGVFDRFSPRNVGSGGPDGMGFRFEDDALNNEACLAGEDWIIAALGRNWVAAFFATCDDRIDDDPIDLFWPVLSTRSAGPSSTGEPCYYYEAHMWRAKDIEIKGLPADTTVRFERDTRIITVGLDVQAGVEEFDNQSGDNTYPIGEWQEPGWNRCILSVTGGAEFARLEPSEGLYGGGICEYNPAFTPGTCISALRLEFYNISGGLLSQVEASTEGASYTRVSIENVIIPPDTAWIQAVHYKLGAGNCTDICIRNLKVNGGPVATGFTVPTMPAPGGTTGGEAGTTSDDIPPGDDTEIPTQDQVSTIGLIPYNPFGRLTRIQNMPAATKESERYYMLTENFALTYGPGNAISMGGEAISVTGADEMCAVIEFRDSQDNLIRQLRAPTAESQGFSSRAECASGASSFPTASKTTSAPVTRIEGITVPSGTAIIIFWIENTDQTENWSVRGQQIVNNGFIQRYTPGWWKVGQADAGSTASNVTVSFDEASLVTLEIAADTVVDFKALPAGVPCKLCMTNNGAGHVVSFGGGTGNVFNDDLPLQWADGVAPTFDTADGAVNIVELIATETVIFAALWGKSFADASKKIRVQMANLRITTYAPTITATALPSKAALFINSYAPSWLHVITVPKASLQLTSYAPSVNIRTTAVVPKGSMVLTTYAPGIPTAVQPPTANLVLATHRPTVTVSWQPPKASLVITTYAPTVTAS